jgi:1-acyl-sn-glycerol-3-phosphate acyltransferase
LEVAEPQTGTAEGNRVDLYYRLARLIVGPLLFLLGTFRVTGRERVAQRGGLIVLSNHLADIDPIVVMYAAGRPIRFMAKSELFAMRFVGGVLRLFQAFPVKRGEADRASIRHAAESARAGHAVGIFPEGQLSEDGKLRELKPGVALIIKMAGCPVICCGVQNTQCVMPYGTMVPRPGFRKMHARWGESRQFTRDTENDEIMDWIEQQLRSLTAA